MANKATNYEIIQRVRLVIDFLLDGLSRYEICQYTARLKEDLDDKGRPGWELSVRQTDRYINIANVRIDRMAEKIEEQSFSKICNRLERQYRRAISKGDGQLARFLIHDMRKLYGFDKPIKIAPTTPDGEDEFSGTSKEIGRRVRKLLEAASTEDSQGSNGKLRLQDNLSE